MQGNGANVFVCRRVGQPVVNVEVNSKTPSPAGTPQCQYRSASELPGKSDRVEVLRIGPATVIMLSGTSQVARLSNPQFTANVDAGKKTELVFEIVSGTKAQRPPTT